MSLNAPAKRSRFARRTKTSPQIDALVDLANRLSQSSSRVEDEFWITRLAASLDTLLRADNETTLTGALDQLFGTDIRAYEGLIDLIEATAETVRADATPASDVLLIAIPILAWSRFPIPSGRIAAAHLADLRVHAQAHLLAADARLCLADHLLSPDQLPQSYCETAQWTQRLVSPALHGKDYKVDADRLPETVTFLSDIRYVLGAVAVPRGGAIFRWQEPDATRESAFQHWREQAGEVVRRMLPACAIDLVGPAAFHSAIRDADRASRPYSLQAAVAFLQTVLNEPAAGFRAIVGAYYDHQLEEYRIGFTRLDESDVLHGVVWPLLDGEDEANDGLGQIEGILRDAGVGDIRALDHRLPLEFCDDCGAPLYPNPEGEAVHAELPEDSENALPTHLH